MADFTAILLSAQSADDNQRLPAEASIKNFEQTNLAQYVASVCMELASESKPAASRQLAGILLKNALISSHSEAATYELGQRWLKLDNESVRVPAKKIMMSTLASPVRAIRSVAAQVVASIASVEVPVKEWSDVVNILVNNISTTTDHNLKAASFEALGFICELIPASLAEFSSIILNAIANGMQPTSPNDIKLAATVALQNSLDFVTANMNDEAQRRIIMGMIFSATGSDDVPIRKAAYGCLVSIAASYYDHLASFMADLFKLTSTAMQSETEDVALQATEFWTTVAEEEAAILEEEADAMQQNRKSTRSCSHYIRTAFPNLAPTIFQNLTKQAEDADEEEWNIAEASGSCLTFCAVAAGDTVLQVTLLFITANITNANWRFREAATLAFGCILNGPSRDSVKRLVVEAFNGILGHLKDPQQHVVDTAAWTLGRICAIVPETISKDMLPQLMAAFVYGLQLHPKIASHICWAIHNLSNNVEVDEGHNTSPLSPYLKGLLDELLKAADRADARNLLMPAYEAINVLINTAAPDCQPVIAQLVTPILAKLQQTLNVATSTPDAKERQNEIQGLLCGCLQVIIQKNGDASVTQHSDYIMTLFLKVLESKNSTVLEEAIMAIGALANKIGKRFEAYINHLKPYLLLGLNKSEEPKVCEVCVGLVGDIARALEDHFIVLGDDVMAVLLNHLQSESINRMIKPEIISCMGDIALALGIRFERYLQFVLRMFVQACQTEFKDADEDTLEYLLKLRISLLEAYTSILFAFTSETNPAQAEILVRTHSSVEAFLSFLDLISKELTSVNIALQSNNTEAANQYLITDDLLKAAVSLIGDLGQTYGMNIAPLLRRDSVKELVNAADKSTDAATKEAANRTMEIVHQLLAGAH